MDAHAPLPAGRRIMEGFARSTGLEGEGPGIRYLWTDAFAVCCFLGLHDATGGERWLELAIRLVDRVHHVLGRHREDDVREGWISGLGEEEGERRPTAGGLRIGKARPERAPGEPYDPEEEWDRDGQYYHYLTRWMHALVRVWRATGDPVFHRWAVELAEASHRAFAHGSGGERRLYWKMSADLSRPLVPSMGQHDALDGLVAVGEIRAAAPPEGVGWSRGDARALDEESNDLRAMCRKGSWATRDPLGIGGLLVDALFLARLVEGGEVEDAPVLERLLSVSEVSLDAFGLTGELDRPAGARLAFRELGLAIGLAAIERASDELGGTRALSRGELAPLLRHGHLRERIDGFWLDPAHREAPTWKEHLDINEVMLATSLMPGGYLGRITPR